MLKATVNACNLQYLAVFRALGGQNGTFTFGRSPRRSDAPAEPGAPRPPFSHMIVGFHERKRHSGPFHWEKGCSRGVYQSIWKIPEGETTKILVPSQPKIQFSPLMVPKEPFCPFFGPGGVTGSIRKHQLLVQLGGPHS